MVAKVPSEINVTAISQLGIVVRDVDKVARNYWNILGIGPWTISYLRHPHLTKRTLHGKPAYFACKVGNTQVGSVEIELIETLEGPTVFDEFLATRGEGPHHVQYKVDSMDAAERHLRLLQDGGFPCVMGAHTGRGGVFYYLDTEGLLKTGWEVAKTPDETDCPTYRYPADDTPSPARIRVDAITQISIAVRDVYETMQNYWHVLGIGPWDVLDIRPPVFHHRTYHGKKANHTFRCAICQMGNLEFELLQTLSGDTYYDDFIRESGEGISHVNFTVDNVAEVSRIMKEEGFDILQGGWVEDSPYAYYNTGGPLKTVWESFQASAGTRPVSFQYPEE
jgi:methylmalonyl-CoA/ethylmalonyl-CoA epimerase